ncbi:MAG TPA: alanyl-tRNA editing protein, partial [Candidatus Nanoarchaeia archaeon]|nr:alanyl-tRNA editing protein [Candidatus Nanoarchaeia archaeon]
MTDALYLNDSYLKEFDATIESVTDGKYVVLDRTAFYPKGGGQDCDTGEIIKDGKEYEVVFVGKFDGKISHEVKNAAELKEGDKVKGLIDWERRHKLMRCHTAEHVLSAIVEKDHHALVTGNELTVEKCRSDYNLETFDREKIDE